MLGKNVTTDLRHLRQTKVGQLKNPKTENLKT